MITLTKEIKAFTVLENTPATFKMEVEVNTATNIDITVDRTNNNKVTATNKQGERIIVLPYLVIEAKQLADDNKPKINLTKTNFDYHKYGKKQVLCNDENTNNEVETMEKYNNYSEQVFANVENIKPFNDEIPSDFWYSLAEVMDDVTSDIEVMTWTDTNNEKMDSSDFWEIRSEYIWSSMESVYETYEVELKDGKYTSEHEKLLIVWVDEIEKYIMPVFCSGISWTMVGAMYQD